MKTVHAVILSVFLLLCTACAQKVNDPADVQAIKDLMAENDKQANALSLPQYTSTFYTTDAVSLQPNGSTIEGVEAIRKYAQKDLDLFSSIKQSLTLASVQSSGDLAVARGTWTWTSSPKASGFGTVNDHGKWVGAFQRQSDGTWKCAYDIWNSDQPAPGSTTSGEDEKALYQLETEWGEAALKKDVAKLDTLLAPEFQSSYVTIPGNKKQFLATLKSDATKIESAVASDMKAFVLGDRAIVDGMSTEKSSMAGKDSSGQYHWTDTWVKRDGKWQCVLGYATKVK